MDISWAHDNTILEIMQGDQYGIPIRIAMAGRILTDGDLAAVEIVIGKLRKTTPVITYSAEIERWILPLTQAETLSMAAADSPAQIRVLFPDGSVKGYPLGMIRIIPTLSREVL